MLSKELQLEPQIKATKLPELGTLPTLRINKKLQTRVSFSNNIRTKFKKLAELPTPLTHLLGIYNNKAAAQQAQQAMVSGVMNLAGTAATAGIGAMGAPAAASVVDKAGGTTGYSADYLAGKTGKY
jgi:hypothetical protein